MVANDSATTFFDKGVRAMLTFMPNENGVVNRFVWKYGDMSFTATRLTDER